MTTHLSYNEVNKLINAIMAAELDDNRSPVTRRVIRGERMRLQSALRFPRGDSHQIVEVAAETERVADLYGISVGYHFRGALLIT